MTLLVSLLALLPPLLVDLLVGLALFAGRHSLAERGESTSTVAAVVLVYGLGYVGANLLMPRLVRPRLALWQAAAGALGAGAMLLVLSACRSVPAILAVFLVIPLFTGLFFNAIQAALLGAGGDAGRTLGRTAGLYTVAWSLGYACGPFVSGWCRGHYDWPTVYRVAAAVSLLAALSSLAAALLARRLARGATPAPAPAADTPEERAGVSLCRAAWLGLFVGYGCWFAIIAGVWPVQAERLGFSAAQKGTVEFAAMAAQALAALALTVLPGWHYRPRFIFALSGAGAAAAAAFALLPTPGGHVLAAALYGAYAACFFILIVFHAMVDRAQAVRRVAVNEIVVGLALVAGPLIGEAISRCASAPGPVYLTVGALLLAGAGAQAIWSARLLARARAG